MCGIVGFVDYHKRSSKEKLKNMTDVLHHRGPDDSGYSFYDEEKYQIGLGHRRLSILDLSKHGHQPMTFENYEIAYNGEVYNFKEIRKELETLGYSFDSDSDTEVILNLFIRDKHACVNKLRGMFAFAIHDKETDELFVARDRLGIKPLNYYWDGQRLIAGSEIKAIYASGKARRRFVMTGVESKTSPSLSVRAMRIL